ncbi:hypothetical protein FTX61_01690 [Nitriliruptoraceae bacterium ZYF776]|nr:hypothetical protein [Profundirhabdus halotolerans]
MWARSTSRSASRHRNTTIPALVVATRRGCPTQGRSDGVRPTGTTPARGRDDPGRATCDGRGRRRGTAYPSGASRGAWERVRRPSGPGRARVPDGWHGDARRAELGEHVEIRDHRPGRRRRGLALAAAGSLAFTMLPVGAAAQTATAPQARSLDNVCAQTPGTVFNDVAGSAHERAVGCLGDLGITVGADANEPTTYDPRGFVRRGQMASFIARTIFLVEGEELPEPEEPPFTDVPGPDTDNRDVHAANINRLAEAGIVVGRSDGSVYDANARVTRGQMATYIARAIDHLDDGDVNGSLPPEADETFFVDDLGTAHGANVERLAAVGVVQGFEDGTYRPNDHVYRDQMASFILRGLSYAEAEGLYAPPLEPAVTLEPQDAEVTVGEAHTVTATVTDELGDVDEDANVVFEVWRDGEAAPVLEDLADERSYTYTTLEPGTDTVVACVVEDDDAEACTGEDGEVTGEATVTWTEPAAAPSGDYAGIVGVCATTDDTVVEIWAAVVDADDADDPEALPEMLAFTVAADDTLLVDGEVTDTEGFAGACELGAGFGAEYDAEDDAPSAFALVSIDDDGGEVEPLLR